MPKSHGVIDSARAAFHRQAEYILQQRQKLRDTQKDALSRDAAAKAGDGEIPRSTLEMAVGRGMTHDAIIKRLKACNPNLYFELSETTKRFGIYYPDPTAIGTALAPRVRYLGMSIAQGMNPEFTPKILDDNGNLKSVTSGYRTVLARLVRQRLISLAAAEKNFGLVDSHNWQAATR